MLRPTAGAGVLGSVAVYGLLRGLVVAWVTREGLGAPGDRPVA